MEEVEDSPDFGSGLVQSYNSPVEHRFSIGLDWSTNGPLPQVCLSPDHASWVISTNPSLHLNDQNPETY